jgi:hypothetical protein
MSPLPEHYPDAGLSSAARELIGDLLDTSLDPRFVSAEPQVWAEARRAFPRRPHREGKPSLTPEQLGLGKHAFD